MCLLFEPMAREEVVHGAVEEVGAGGLGAGQLVFELMARAHGFINFGDDAPFFGGGW